MGNVNNKKKNEEIFYVYIYWNDKYPIYVGKGHNGRAFDHLGVCCNRQLNTHIKRNMKDISVVFYATELTEEQAFDLEINLILLYGRRDLKTGTLFNHTNGGDGAVGQIITEQTKLKMSVASKKKWLDPIFRRKTIHAQIAGWTSMAKDKNRLSHFGKSSGMSGKIHTEDAKLKIGIASKKKWSDPIFRRKQMVSHEGKYGVNKGRIWSDDYKKNMSIAVSGENNGMYGKTHSEETKIKISLVKTGKRFTQEQKDARYKKMQEKYPDKYRRLQ